LKSDEEFNLDQWYKNNYNRINATAVPNSLPNQILHKLIEKSFKSNANMRVLEVGSNAGEHLPYVSADFASYVMTDIRPLAADGTLERIRSDHTGAGIIQFQIADVHNLPFEDNSFDRVISTCLFHHLDNPMEAFREARRVTKIGGTVSILIPNDPGILYRMLRGLTTLQTAKKNGLHEEVQLVHAIEHKNHYLQLRTLLAHVFRQDETTAAFFPLKIKSYNLNALTIFHIKKIA
jgi:phosphatidylethanolamine/phosphatidyl-N-methylethanolamine N-methyltransferase